MIIFNYFQKDQFRDIESTFRQRMIEKWKPIKPKTFKSELHK